MGCNQCKEYPKNELNTRENSSIITYNSLLNLQISKNSLSYEKIYLRDKNLSELTSSLKISKSQKLFLIIKKLSNLKNNLGQFFPNINIKISQENNSKVYIHEENDILKIRDSLGKSDTDLNEVEINVPLENLNLDIFYNCEILIKDNLVENSQINVKFYFRLVNKNNNKSFDVKSSIFNKVEAFSIGNLSVSSINMIENEKEIINSREGITIDFNSRISMKISEIFGLEFKKNNEKKVSIGFSNLVLDENGNTIYFKGDIFPVNNSEFSLEDFEDFAPYLLISTDIFTPNQNFTWICKLWDKFGEGEISFIVKFFVRANIVANFKVIDNINIDGKNIAKIRGKEGFFECKDFVACIDSKIEKKLRNFREKAVKIQLDFNKGKNNEINVLFNEENRIKSTETFFVIANVLE